MYTYAYMWLRIYMCIHIDSFYCCLYATFERECEREKLKGRKREWEREGRGWRRAEEGGKKVWKEGMSGWGRKQSDTYCYSISYLWSLTDIRHMHTYVRVFISPYSFWWRWHLPLVSPAHIHHGHWLLPSVTIHRDRYSWHFPSTLTCWLSSLQSYHVRDYALTIWLFDIADSALVFQFLTLAIIVLCWHFHFHLHSSVLCLRYPVKQDFVSVPFCNYVKDCVLLKMKHLHSEYLSWQMHWAEIRRLLDDFAHSTIWGEYVQTAKPQVQ